MIHYLTTAQVLFIHARLIAETGGAPGLRDLRLLAAAVARPQASFGSVDLYPDVPAKAAALMHSLVGNHPFLDGNKRTGIAAAGLFLRLNGQRLTADNPAVEQFALAVARGELSITAMAEWFVRNSEPHHG